jgi:hypothetical protein
MKTNKRDKVITEIALFSYFIPDYKELPREMNNNILKYNIKINDVENRKDYLFLAMIEDWLTDDELKEIKAICRKKKYIYGAIVPSKAEKEAWKREGMLGLYKLYDQQGRKLLDDILGDDENSEED